MTTKITVDAHAGWPVKVAGVSPKGLVVSPAVIVAANTTQDFHVHDGQMLIVSEEPRPDGDTAALSEGEYRVGKSFNPSANAMVDIIKAKAAEFIDLLAPIAADRDHPGARCAALAMTEIEIAAMWAVKAVTKPAR